MTQESNRGLLYCRQILYQLRCHVRPNCFITAVSGVQKLFIYTFMDIKIEWQPLMNYIFHLLHVYVLFLSVLFMRSII